MLRESRIVLAVAVSSSPSAGDDACCDEQRGRDSQHHGQIVNHATAVPAQAYVVRRAIEPTGPAADQQTGWNTGEGTGCDETPRPHPACRHLGAARAGLIGGRPRERHGKATGFGWSPAFGGWIGTRGFRTEDQGSRGSHRDTPDGGLGQNTGGEDQ